MMSKIYSLRQHDLDQVIRVERGSLLSVPHRGTPRSVVGVVIRRTSYFVNTQTDRQVFRSASTLLSNYHGLI